MADNRKYYYLRLKEGFFDTEEIKILESMKDGYIYSNILLKLYLKSLKNEGRLMYRNVIPYTPEILATLVGHQVGTVEKALETFRKLDLIEVLDNGAIYMLDIQNLIGSSSTEADRQREYYNRIKNESSRLKGVEKQKIPEKDGKPEPVPKGTEKQKRENTLQIFQRLAPEYNLSEPLKEKIAEWMKYKIERKEGYKEQGMKSFLRQMEKKSLKFRNECVLELIDSCMANGWKVIIWDILEKENYQAAGSDRIQRRVSEVDGW